MFKAICLVNFQDKVGISAGIGVKQFGPGDAIFAS